MIPALHKPPKEKAAVVLPTPQAAQETTQQRECTPVGNKKRTAAMTPIVTILDLLVGVRQRQPGQYSALCPAHADKSPSLSVRENPDGAVLINCLAGCDVHDVVAAIGLEMHELFPPRERPAGAPKRIPRLLTAGQALDLLADEATLIAVAGGNVGHGVTLSPEDTERVLMAAGRINYLREQTGAQHA